jgi:hypothetical protein
MNCQGLECSDEGLTRGVILASTLFVCPGSPRRLYPLHITNLGHLIPISPQIKANVTKCAKFADRGCHMIGVTNPTAVNYCLLDQSRYFLGTAPQLSSRG